MIKAIVIDDEPLAISLIRDYLRSFTAIELVKECRNGEDALKAIAEHKPDLIFLDIQMPKISGFEVLELLEEPLPLVIFSTAYDEYAVKAFEQNAVDYLLKPYSKERFDKAVNKALNASAGNPASGTASGVVSGIGSRKMDNLISASSGPGHQLNKVVVRSGNAVRIIPLQEIQYLEAYDDYVKINTANDCFLKKKTMQYFEDALNPDEFLRVHRSFILKLDQITKIEPEGRESHVAVLKSGTKIPLSKTGFAKLKQSLGLTGH